MIIGCAALTAPVASAAIALVEKGTLATATGTSITPTLSSETTSGDFLTAALDDVNADCSTDAFTAPTGWVEAAHACRGSDGPIELWYLPDTAAGVTSVKFSGAVNGANMAAQLSEWSGVATSSPLDQTGTNASTTASTTLSVSTSAALSAGNEFALTAFGTASGLSTFTPASGWTALDSDSSGGFDSNYDLAPAGGASLSGTVTSSPSTAWGSAIASFYGGCGGGSLGLTSPATAAFGSLTLNGTNQTVSTNLSFTPTDATGSGSGWNLTGTSTTFKNAASKTLPTTATTVTAASVATTSGTCRLPTNAITYPVTLPAAATAPTAVKLYDAAAATGLGPSTVSLTFGLAVPPNSYSGAYSSTWTFSLVSGP